MKNAGMRMDESGILLGGDDTVQNAGPVHME